MIFFKLLNFLVPSSVKEEKARCFYKEKNKNIVWDNNDREYGKTKEVEKLSRKQIEYF